MSVVDSKCPVESCIFHDAIVSAEIAHVKTHIKKHDYKILLETACNLGIIDDTDERRSVNWLVDELFKASRCVPGVVSS